MQSKMATETQSLEHQALKLQSKIAGSISRRSAHRRRRKGRASTSDGSVVSGISSCCSESIDIMSDLDDGKSSFAGESSISESYTTPVACEPIEEDIIKLTVDVPVRYYGDYRTINQNEFFMECMVNSDSSCVVHFFDENNPESIEVDGMLGQLAKKYTGCKFLRLDSTTTPFVCSKLAIKSFPTVLAIRNKVILDRLTDTDGSMEQNELERWIVDTIPLITGK